ncbi:MAG TPA: stalk domain-containing protein [Bacilli bacterium]
MSAFAKRFRMAAKTALLSTLALATLLGTADLPAQAASAQPTQQPKITVKSEQPITAGAILRQVVWESARSGKAVRTNANIIVVDLQNPYVQLDVMTGVNNQFTKRQNVEDMAVETHAVAGVNGDYFNVQGEGAPIGPEVRSGALWSSPSFLDGMYAFALTADRKPVIDSFTFAGSVKAANGETYPLAGINKAVYWTDPNKTHSHANAIQMYTSAWGQVDRGNDGATTPTEVLVRNNVVEQIADNGVINAKPPQDGYILRTSGKAADFIRNNVKIGDKITVDYHFISNTTKKAADPAQFQMMIGGHTILVDQGKPAKFSRDVSSLGGYRSRTGIGYSRDGRYVYIVTVDAGGDSKGMSLPEFQQFLALAGAWKALNLDGGGSTQMVSRPLGDFAVQVVNQPENGSLRKVVNGLGVYTKAPKGKIAGLIVEGNKLLFVGERETYNLKAYDQYFNPLRIDAQSVHWSLPATLGQLSGNTMVATKPGVGKLIAKQDNAQAELPVEVVGKEQITDLHFTNPAAIFAPGGKYKLNVVATTKSGAIRNVPADLLHWDMIGFTGTVNDGVLTVNSTGKDGSGHLIATFDGYAAMLTSAIGVDKKLDALTSIESNVTKQKTPAEISGDARVVSDLPGTRDNEMALYFEYNFKNGTGTKAIYASYGDKGIAVAGKPLAMKADIYGDNSLNWIRAEVIDKNGALQRIDFTRLIDWYGWKEIDVDLSQYNLAYPITIKRIYVVNPEEGQDEREPIGAIAIKNIRFQYVSEAPQSPKVSVKMAVNRKSITVNGQNRELDQAPVIVNGSTMIPVRFFIDAMGGEVQWTPADKQVKIIRDHHLIQMWIGQEDLIIDGKRVTADAPPRVMNGRSMLPLRLISESLGWKVGWDNATKSVTLE